MVACTSKRSTSPFMSLRRCSVAFIMRSSPKLLMIDSKVSKFTRICALRSDELRSWVDITGMRLCGFACAILNSTSVRQAGDFSVEQTIRQGGDNSALSVQTERMTFC